MDNRNESNRVVDPQLVDLNKVQVDHDDTMLNRERDNIVSATIQANDSVDESKIKVVNNRIQVEKKNKTFNAMIVITVIMVVIVVTIGGLMLVKNLMNYGDEEPQDNIKVTEENRFLNYVNNRDIVRKFQYNGEYKYDGRFYKELILLISPIGYDLKDNNSYFMLIMNDGENSYVESGIYEFDNNTIKAGRYHFDIKNDVINSREFKVDLKMRNTEMKYYKHDEDTVKEILIINGTTKSEQALYIASNNVITNVYHGFFMEDANSIKLNNGTTFIKNGVNVVLNGKEFTYNY